MAKKVAKKAASKKKVARAKKPAAKKKAPAKKAAAKKSVKKVSRMKRPAKKATRAKAPARKASPKKSPQPRPGQRVEKMAVSIEGPNKSGDLAATESMGETIRVHHTVHPGAETTPIPGKSYDDLKRLGPGAHEVDVTRPISPAPAITPEHKWGRE